MSLQMFKTFLTLENITYIN